MKEIRPFLAGIVLAFILAGWVIFMAVQALEAGAHGYVFLAFMMGVYAGFGVLGFPLLLFWAFYMWRQRGHLPARVHALIFLPPLISLLVVPLVAMNG